jgi:hypothetical protein
LASFIAVSASWMIRNSIVFGEPLGSMGPINLAAAYSDIAFQRRGVWGGGWSIGAAPEFQTDEFKKKLVA